jgi:hypothetical protein
MNKEFALWIGILVPPCAWFLSLEANFALAPLACTWNSKLALYGTSLIAFTLSACAGVLSWSQRGTTGGKSGASALRFKTLGNAGMLLSAMFCLTIVAQAIPQFILAGCE